ncbi:signal transduction histidine kinase [Agromyces terreus]|uniref:Signal transduction histidine kinase n=1 Tax=Agromyces terreus TaxID=424795 RepID=A0A9X2H253_9MICO|nr:ATP-binding protein [Agromyces terreus]MCP2371270.1 signal transduction histidine kinase [Agromyces terreus]
MPAAEARLARETTRRRTAVTREQVETVAARALGTFGIVFGAQALPLALAQSTGLRPGAGVALVAVLYGSILAVALAAATKVAVRSAALVFAVLYAGAILAWPLIVVDLEVVADSPPWLYFLCTVATTAAVVALPTMWAVAYTVLVPAMYGVVRLLPAGGGASVSLAILDAVYALILGAVVLIIVTMLRNAARAVDVAQEAALERYESAVRQHASELERAKVDALVHDSVLTTLLSAAAANAPDEQALAARMARDAVRRLDQAGVGWPQTGDRVGLPHLVRRLRAALATFAVAFTVRVVNTGGVEIPVEAADALSTAAVQAMVNSMQHAEDGERVVRREVRVRGIRTGGCAIEIADTGVGFDVEQIPAERLGVRVSIIERMANAGGAARIDSAVGRGTTVTLLWPAGVEADR